jgi:tetratricopeptide (TPR) repeat protein
LTPNDAVLLNRVLDGLCSRGEGQRISQGLVLDPSAKHLWHHVTTGSSYRGDDALRIITAARRLCRLAPESEISYFELSRVFLREDFGLDAIDALMRTVCLAPAMPEAWVSIGVTEKTVGRTEYALKYLPRSLILRPDFAIAAARYARILAETGHRHDAIALVERAVQLDAQLFDAWFTRGFVFRLLNNLDESCESFYRCIALRPDRADCWVSLGIARHMHGDLEGALSTHARALTLDLFCREGFANYAFAMKELGRYDDAVGAYSKAIIASPDLFDAYVNSAICNLLMGRFSLGWRQYEFRWRSESAWLLARSSPPLRTSKVPFGGDQRSKRSRVLVWAEQGLGDEVMFGSLLHEFQQLCGEMIVQVDARLLGLFTRAFPKVRFLERGRPVSEEDYDEHIPMGSLGLWMRPTRASFQGRGRRYLFAHAELASRIRSFFGAGSGRKVVGLSWRSFSEATGLSRSLDLIQLIQALNIDSDILFLNLQYGDVHDELEALQTRIGVQVLSHPDVDTLNDIEGLAGLIDACDLVVSVGNATAHLAGALGKTTLVLLPYVAGWRWLHEGDRCLWYSNVRLYRQAVRGDWSDPLRRISNDIKKHGL